MINSMHLRMLSDVRGEEHYMTESSIASRVRQNTASAAVAAICLIVFGFFGFFSIPKVTDLFTLGDAAFNYTLRIGGVLMAVIAVWSFLGRVTALLADAMVSVAIGCLLIFSGVAMIIGGGGVSLNYGLYVLFGGMFISAGLRNWRDFSLLKTTQPTAERDDRIGFGSPPAPFEENALPVPTSSSLAGRLRERMAGQKDAKPEPLPDAAASASPPCRPTSSIAEQPDLSATLEDVHSSGATQPAPDEEATLRAENASGSDSKEDGHDDQPPPSGFLASFAEEEPTR